MPELPELEVVREILDRRVVGESIVRAEAVLPGSAIVVRDSTGRGFSTALAGATVERARRIGKFIVLDLAPAPGGAAGDAGEAVHLAINPKLTGRLQLARHGDRRPAATCAVLVLPEDRELRYLDPRKMGQVYLTANLASIPELALEVSDALAIPAGEFRERLRRFRGEIKGILTRGELVSGIGNAYADEILWAARIHPYRKRTTLSAGEIDRLHEAMRSTLLAAIDLVRAAMGERIDQKPREFLAVHLKSGEPCPRCGHPISLVGANQKITNFCRNCQPGGLLRGMGR
jgi:formamidopyrimidine-DNA glycosylase